ncbi:MAG: DNA repair protein RadC [Methanobacteriota archaeon]
MVAKKMREIDRLDRPREKIEKRGAGCLADHELIAAILGKGTWNRDVLEISREVATMLKKDDLPKYNELIGIEGIGQSKACILLACFEIARRYGTPEEEPVRRITSPVDILNISDVKDLKTKKQEYFLTVTLNGASEVIKSRTITMGLLNHSLIHPREVFADAIADRAATIVCIHNHPSGNLEPSSQDIQITSQLVSAGEILGINVVDHVIVSKNGILSLRESGYI